MMTTNILPDHSNGRMLSQREEFIQREFAMLCSKCEYRISLNEDPDLNLALI